MISSLSPGDSGLISCHYTYLLDAGTSNTISVDKAVCVAPQPLPPACFGKSSYGDTVTLICTAANVCPDDVTLRWFDVDAMAELTGDVTRGTNVIENLIITSRPDSMSRNYRCQLESTLYPMVRLNCTNSQSPPGVVSTIKSLSSTSGMTRSTKYLTTTSAFDLLSTYSITTSTDPMSEAISEQKTTYLKTQIDIAEQTSRSTVNIVTTSTSESSSANIVTDKKCICEDGKSSSNSNSSEWAVSTTALFAVIACISIAINVYFGLRLYQKREEKPTPAASAKDKKNVSNLQEPYMELGIVDEPNEAYMTLKSCRCQSAPIGADKASDYEVTLPSIPSEGVTNAKNEEGIEHDIQSKKPKEKHYVNADRIDDFSRRFKKPVND